MPLNLAQGLGYKKSFNCGRLKLLGISSEISSIAFFNRSDSYQYFQPERAFNAGLEICLLNTISPQMGYSVDLSGAHYQITWGIGFDAFNHFRLDLLWTYHERNVFAYYPASYGFTVSFDRILNWHRTDTKWWLVN
jgi:hypothetical protein